MDIGNKKSLLPFLFSGADIYRKNLLNRAFLFIGQASNNIPAPVIECVFLSENFMHLTGCQVSGNLSPTNFFELCLNRRLAPDMFDCLSEAFLKKDVLETVFSLPYSAKMMGMHSGVGNLLYTEKLAGTVRGCMGFVLGSSAPYLSPNTVLKEDIRNMVETSHKILAVYEKPRGAVLYNSSRGKAHSVRGGMIAAREICCNNQEVCQFVLTLFHCFDIIETWIINIDAKEQVYPW